MKICRTCLQVLSGDDCCLSLDIDDCNLDSPSVRNKLLICVPELALDVVQCAVICTSCSDALNTAYDFKNKCMQTEERIMNYTQLTGCAANSVNISEVVQFSELNTDHDVEHTKQQLTDIHYPITQIIEQDSEVDTKSFINPDAPKKAPLPEPPAFLYETDIIPPIIKMKADTSNAEAAVNGLESKILQVPFNPELDVEVRNYRGEPLDFLLQDTQQLSENAVEENPECMYCRRSFSQLTELESHLMMHTENRPLKCTMCERRFVRKDKLMLHMRIHTGEKPFHCSLCGRCFSRKDKLNNHMRTHTGEKPHQCILCQKCFARKDKMNTHMRSQHWLALANLEITVVKNAAGGSDSGTASQ